MSNPVKSNPAGPLPTQPPSSGLEKDQFNGLVAGTAERQALERMIAGPGRRRRSPGQSRTTNGRDPVPLGELVEQDLIERGGWRHEAAVASLTSRWDEILGQAAAQHANPTSYDGSTLVVQADSTAWATQLRLLLPQIQRNIDQIAGPGVVSVITVAGPARPRGRGGWRVQ